jgi:hypothetical protein
VYAGCQLYTLYRVLDKGTALDLAQGITVGSTSRARNGSLVEHGWGGKVTQADLEVYAHDPASRYGDVRLRVPGFPHTSPLGDVAYSDDIGHINLPRMGDADVGVLVGTATGKDGRPMPPRSFKLDAFGHGNTGHRTGLVKGRELPALRLRRRQGSRRHDRRQLPHQAAVDRRVRRPHPAQGRVVPVRRRRRARRGAARPALRAQEPRPEAV